MFDRAPALNPTARPTVSNITKRFMQVPSAGCIVGTFAVLQSRDQFGTYAMVIGSEYPECPGTDGAASKARMAFTQATVLPVPTARRRARSVSASVPYARRVAWTLGRSAEATTALG